MLYDQLTLNYYKFTPNNNQKIIKVVYFQLKNYQFSRQFIILFRIIKRVYNIIFKKLKNS